MMFPSGEIVQRGILAKISYNLINFVNCWVKSDFNLKYHFSILFWNHKIIDIFPAWWSVDDFILSERGCRRMVVKIDPIPASSTQILSLLFSWVQFYHIERWTVVLIISLGGLWPLVLWYYNESGIQMLWVRKLTTYQMSLIYSD